jgi:hypothetical protein
MELPEKRANKSGAVLVVCPEPETRGRLREMPCQNGLRMYEAGAWREATASLVLRRPQIVLCEALLPDADWHRSYVKPLY